MRGTMKFGIWSMSVLTRDIQADNAQLLFRLCLLVGTFLYNVTDNSVRELQFFTGTTGTSRSCSRIRHSMPGMMSTSNEAPTIKINEWFPRAF